MELLEGKTLTQLIPSNGIDVEYFLRFSAPLAEELSTVSNRARCVQRITRLEFNQRIIQTAGVQLRVRRNVDCSASLIASGRRSGDRKFCRWPRSRYYCSVVSIFGKDYSSRSAGSNAMMPKLNG
jgi:hypothetical protein